jgi:uncharacterized protein
MIGDRSESIPKLFTYLRYNVELSAGSLQQLGLGHIRPEDVQQMDSVAHIEEMRQVGRTSAANVKAEHFAGFPVE